MAKPDRRKGQQLISFSRAFFINLSNQIPTKPFGNFKTVSEEFASQIWRFYRWRGWKMACESRPGPIDKESFHQLPMFDAWRPDFAKILFRKPMTLDWISGVEKSGPSWPALSTIMS
jgi:hypothetical protein